MKNAALIVVSLLACIDTSSCFKQPPTQSNYKRNSLSKALAPLFDGAPTDGRDLTGHSLWVKFTGFGVEDMNFGIELNQNFQAIYSRGLESAFPGFWRVVKYDDGKETLEVTQPGTMKSLS